MSVTFCFEYFVMYIYLLNVFFIFFFEIYIFLKPVQQSRAAADVKDVEGKKAALEQKLESGLGEMGEDGMQEEEVQVTN